MNQQAFTDYLSLQEHFNERGVIGHVNNLNHFIRWAESKNMLDIDHATYNDLLGFVQHEKQRGLKVQTVKLRLNSISKYYECLKHVGLLDKNPTRKISLKGEMKSITQNVFSYTELEELYNNYVKIKRERFNIPTLPFVKQKYNVLAGLMIFQGANSGSIIKMTLDDVNLSQGTVNIPKKGRSASRELNLLPVQILELYKYIHEARPKLKTKGNELINGYVHDQCGAVVKQLSGVNPKVKDAAQIRASIIIHWIKVHGKRKAQYMAGHKNINSTEFFELQELDSLTDALMKHHPFSNHNFSGNPFG